MSAILAPVMLMSALGVSPTPASTWMNDYNEALKAAKQAKRPLLVVLDVPGDPAKRLPQVTRTDETQGVLLKPYTLCHIDASTEYGKKVATAFKAKSFPHTAVIDKTASVILYSKSGVISTNEWVTTLVKHQTGNRPIVSTFSMQPVATCFT